MSRKSRSSSRACRARWFGWRVGRYEEPRCFTDNHRPASLTAPSDRLVYYGKHSGGRGRHPRGNHLLEES